MVRHMQNMIPMCINLAELPEDDRRRLCEEAVKRGVPFEQVVREAMQRLAQELLKKPEPQKA